MEKLKSKRVLFLLLLPVAIATFFLSREIGTFYYENYSHLKTSNIFLESYKSQIAQSTNPYKTAQLGMVFLKTGYPDLALLALDKAASLDSNWRDAWIWKGYTEIELSKPQDALVSLRQAEKLDPTYAFTYQLLAKTYTKLGNSAEAKSAQEKLTALNK